MLSHNFLAVNSGERKLLEFHSHKCMYCASHIFCKAVTIDSRTTHRALTIRPKIPKFSKRGQMIRKFQKFRKLLNFRKANHSTENSGNSGRRVKRNGNFQEKLFENLGIPQVVVLCFEISANSQFSTQR